MSDLPLTGGCNCGAVRFEVTEPLVYAYYCHCTRCRRRSGAGSAPGGIAAPGSFKLLQGESDLRTWSAGDGFDKLFCSICGSQVLARSPENHELVAIRLGAFDGDPGIRPTARHFVNYAAAWEPVDPDDGLIHHPEALPRG
ncbi:MAG: GFA family protein [Solirubrobacterales bacterium]